nr:PREDICTED: carcinoembryonic antigen-related cell adhesion molecule 8-like [Latimeria chalumnae]|eukprot:XP_005988239.2 PREDICTED: carcinoembryonic antigen-related cell adhesion molecule 8-like [Latimeria chalumnae]
MEHFCWILLFAGYGLTETVLYRAVGQSVLLSVSCCPRFNISQSLLQWSVKKPDSNRILTYNNGNMQATSGYQDRVQLYPNGSLLLHNLNASDAGSYTVTWTERNGQETRGTIQLIIHGLGLQPSLHQFLSQLQNS